MTGPKRWSRAKADGNCDARLQWSLLFPKRCGARSPPGFAHGLYGSERPVIRLFACMSLLRLSRSGSPRRAALCHHAEVKQRGRKHLATRIGWERSSERLRLPESLDLSPKAHAREFVERVAKAQGVQYHRTGFDDFAETATRLTGDGGTVGATGELLATLRRPVRKRALASALATISGRSSARRAPALRSAPAACFSPVQQRQISAARMRKTGAASACSAVPPAL